jgi:hypothetical protein
MIGAVSGRLSDRVESDQALPQFTATGSGRKADNLLL